MTLQQFINFDQYVRCFTFGKMDITPVAYDPKERRYLVDHNYLSAELGARIVKDAQTINQALGYEMNTIEFAVENGVPYAIDFLNPAPDFERDRITEFYFGHVVEKMAKLVIDRALKGNVANSWPRWEEMLGIGAASGFHRCSCAHKDHRKRPGEKRALRVAFEPKAHDGFAAGVPLIIGRTAAPASRHTPRAACRESMARACSALMSNYPLNSALSSTLGCEPRN